jgi:hypothetical protein
VAVPLGLDPNDPRVRSAGFAELIEDFWKSDIGQYLMKRAKEESDEATILLVEHAHTMKPQEIRNAQTAIWRASKFAEWLGEAYAAGCADLKILEEETDSGS